MACVRYFEAKFPGVEHEKVGVHPNHYFISAMKAIRKKTKIEYEKAEDMFFSLFCMRNYSKTYRWYLFAYAKRFL